MKKLVLLSIIIIFFSIELANAQCAMCKAVVESDEGSIKDGLNTGILYLMAFPYLLVGIGIFLWLKKYKKFKT